MEVENLIDTIRDHYGYDEKLISLNGCEKLDEYIR